MNPQAAQQTHSSTWVTFTYVSFIGSVVMVAAGIVLMPLDIWIKGYFAMGIVMLIQTCVSLTKTIRDVHEGGKLVNRIEDAKALVRVGVPEPERANPQEVRISVTMALADPPARILLVEPDSQCRHVGS